MTWQRRILLFVSAMVALHTTVFANVPQSSSQDTPATGRIFSLYGDVNVLQLDEAVAPPNAFFDLILYTDRNESIARQRVAKGGRYRFTNIPEGNYFISVELNNVEIARVALLVSQKKASEMRQDLELEWTADMGKEPGFAPPQSYVRSNQNRELYEGAMKQINRNDLAKATATLRSIVEADPKDFPAWSELAMVYWIQKNYEAAATSYAKTIELKPDYITARVSLARVRLAQKNNDAAIRVLEDALKADPNSPTVHYFLGEAYLALRKGSIAIDYLKQAIKLDPIGMARAHLRIAALYHLAGYKDLAAIEYNEFLKKKPDYPESQKMREYIIANNPRTKRKPSPSPGSNP